MFSVIFEVLTAEGKKDEYLDLAKNLKPIIESIDGFVDNERFDSLRRRGWLLSHVDDDNFRMPRRDSIARRLIEDWLHSR